MPCKNNGKTKTENKSGLVDLAAPVTPPGSTATTASQSPLVNEGDATIDTKFKSLLAAKAVPTVIKLLEQARTELKGAYDMRWVFDKFLAVALAALEGKRIQAAWEFAKASYARGELDEVTYHTMLLHHNKMQNDWQRLVVTGGLSPAMPTFVKALAVLAYSAKDDYRDYLGTVYMKLGAANKWNGQYFTPFEIARLKAELILGDVSDWPSDKPLSICDPTVGSGALLLAAADVIAMRNPKLLANGQVYLFGSDIDYTCVQMAKLNLILHGLDSLSQRGFCKEPSTAKLYSELTWEEQTRMEASFGKSVEELEKEAWQMRQLQLPGMSDC